MHGGHLYVHVQLCASSRYSVLDTGFGLEVVMVFLLIRAMFCSGM